VTRRDQHLGELAAALVDGALDHDTRDRAFAHLARCGSCRAEVDGQRRLKARLAALDTPPCPTALLGRLRTIAETSPGSASLGGLPDLGGSFGPPAARLVTTGAAGPAGPGGAGAGSGAGAARPSAPRRDGRGPSPRRGPGGRGPAAGPSRASRRRRAAAAAAGGLAAFALTLAAVGVLGAPDRGRPVAPEVGTYTVEHTRTSDGVPGADPAAGIVDAATVSR